MTNDDSSGEDEIIVKKADKKVSVEKIYQKKTQLEHILLRPDSYIGSVEPCQQSMWIFDFENDAIISKSITFTPGLYKIFDEILVNAADNKQRDPRMNSIKVNIDVEKNTISIWNNGKGIPIEMHKTEKMYVPTLIFGHLLTSSNYDDTEKKVVGGRNGFGAKLCNIFSSKFTVETVANGKKFKQTWKNNMKKVDPEKIIDFSGTDFTCITFSPDLPKFKMEKLDDDFVSLLKRRAYDIAGVCRGVTVTLNGQKLKVRSFKDYVQLHLKGAGLSKKDGEDLESAPLPKIVHEIVNPRWEVCVTVSDSGFQQSSFVNSIATSKGGTHVNYLVDQICEKLISTVKKKTGKGGFNIRPFQVKSHLWVFANTLIENPTFDSQTKENMTLRKTAFGSKCELSDKYVKQVQDCGVLDNILSWVKYKSETQLNKKTYSSKHSRLKGIPKLDDANDAGTSKSRSCTLIVTEGDSAKALAVSGLSVVGRDKYGVFPLRGKMLNVRDATHKQIMENAEVGYLLKIIGLQFGKKYTEEDMKTLRYGHLMIMADQDTDGSHIKGLVINFIHAHWPMLLQLNFLEEFITPILKASKGKEVHSFFSLPEFEEWKSETPNYKSWRVKYYKGLGTSTSKEGKEYFSNMQRHRVVFDYDGPSSDQALVMAFSKKCANERKEWLTTGMEQRKLRREAGLPEIYLYEKDTTSVSYRDFVNKELILFSNSDNERSIPSVVDGLKPGQRKVLFTCMKRNDKTEVKVAQLAGSVSEMSAYHHGEASLMGTIVGLAQNFVGSNNLNLLVPHGQFGTRNLGGKDSASPRYICTMMSSLTRLVFPADDDYVLTFLYEDNRKIEPEWYCPIIPMVLVNGAEGIGTGYATKVPNYDVRELISVVKKFISGDEQDEHINPAYKNFVGDIESTDRQRYASYGVISVLDDRTVEISELPVRCWTQNYKESVMDVMLYGTEKVRPQITDYKEYHSDTTVRFVVSMTPELLAKAETEGLHKTFKLDSSFSTTSMVLFDEFGCIRKFETVKEIIKSFQEVRLKKYQERRIYLLGMLEAECAKLQNQARFIMEKIEGKVIIENKSRQNVITSLVARGYASDPVKTWKATIDAEAALEDDQTDDASSTSTASGGPDFQYLLTMPIMSLSKEKKEELLRQRDEKQEELDILRSKSPQDMWLNELDMLLEELDQVEEQERLDEKASAAIKKVNIGRSPKGRVAATPKRHITPKKVKVKTEEGGEKPKAVENKENNKNNVKKSAKKKIRKKYGSDSDDSDQSIGSDYKPEAGNRDLPTPKRTVRQHEAKKYFDGDSDSNNESDDDINDVDVYMENGNNKETDVDIDIQKGNALKGKKGDSATAEESETLALIDKLSPMKSKVTKPPKPKSKLAVGSDSDEDPFGLSPLKSDKKTAPKRSMEKSGGTSSDEEPRKKKQSSVETSHAQIKEEVKFSDSDESDNELQMKIKTKILKKFAAKPANDKMVSCDVSDSESQPTSPPVPVKKVPSGKKSSAKKLSKNGDDEAGREEKSCESEGKSKAAKKPPVKRKSVSTPKSGKKVTPKKASKAKKFEGSGSDGSDYELHSRSETIPVGAERVGRGRSAAVVKKKYTFSSNEEDNSDDFY